MKIKELIQYDDFMVELATDNYPYKWHKIVGVADVSYSAKEIVLNMEKI